MDAFFNKGGVTSFIDNIAGSLGIHASTIKVVSVYKGSVVANYAIEAEKEKEGEKKDPKAPKKKTLAEI